MRRLWTCIIDFRGGTYIRQVSSGSAQSVLQEVLETISADDVEGMTPSMLSAMRAAVALNGGDPVPIESMRGVYCVSAVAGDELLLAHIVETAGSARRDASPSAHFRSRRGS
jgi:hypothetical protein